MKTRVTLINHIPYLLLKYKRVCKNITTTYQTTAFQKYLNICSQHQLRHGQIDYRQARCPSVTTCTARHGQIEKLCWYKVFRVFFDIDARTPTKGGSAPIKSHIKRNFLCQISYKKFITAQYSRGLQWRTIHQMDTSHYQVDQREVLVIHKIVFK